MWIFVPKLAKNINLFGAKKFRWVFFKHCGIIVFTGNDISSERFFKRGSAQTNAWWRFFAHYSFMHWKHTWAERKILRLMQENNPHYSLASFDSLTSVELRNWFSTQGWCWTEAKAIQGVPTRSAFLGTQRNLKLSKVPNNVGSPCRVLTWIYD